MVHCGLQHCWGAFAECMPNSFGGDAPHNGDDGQSVAELAMVWKLVCRQCAVMRLVNRCVVVVVAAHQMEP